MNLYEVKAKCGHVGRNNYVVKSFAIEAENGKEAAQKARYIPRVKHDQKYAIVSVSRIDEERFNEINKENRQDLYFRCKCMKDQRSMIEDGKLDLCVLEDPEVKHFYKENQESDSNRVLFFRKEKIKNPKRFFDESILNMGGYY